MVSPQVGFALVSNDPFHPTSAVWIAETVDGARTWRFRGTLPSRADTVGGVEYIPNVHFVSPRVGYVLSAYDVVMTTDAGATWSVVHAAGTPTGWALGRGTLALVTRACGPFARSTTCPASASTWSWGAHSPTWTGTVPLLASLDAQTVEPLALTPSGDLIAWEGVTGGGGAPGLGALLETSAGSSPWRRIPDPCGIETGSQQIVQLDPSSWLLSCFLGEGMMQGKSSIWRTSDAGAHWSLVNRQTDTSSTRANVGTGGGGIPLSVSLDGSILYGTGGGAVGGVTLSRDGGVRWTSALLDGLGGAPVSISPIGPRGAIVSIDDGLTYRTTNGRTWSVLPPLPAGRYHGLAMCAPPSTSAALSPVHLRGIPGYYPLVFTDQSPNPCYLTGTPIVHGVGRGRAVGLPATRNVTFTTHTVILKARGSVASVGVAIDLTGAAGLGYPASCAPRQIDAINVEFAPTAAFRVKLPHGGLVCTRVLDMSVGSVVKGSSASGS
ncbi:MAG: DUF4232 domain-containing protein [Acidimicrobiales bacterium]